MGFGQTLPGPPPQNPWAGMKSGQYMPHWGGTATAESGMGQTIPQPPRPPVMGLGNVPIIPGGSAMLPHPDPAQQQAALQRQQQTRQQEFANQARFAPGVMSRGMVQGNFNMLSPQRQAQAPLAMTGMQLGKQGGLPFGQPYRNAYNPSQAMGQNGQIQAAQQQPQQQFGLGAWGAAKAYGG